MKLAQAIEYIPAILQLTSDIQQWATVTSISFLNGIHPNFLNAFFMRPE
ncbi:MAG: hypothetical protein ABI184_00160 [Ginsengibacter sp.]